MAVLVGDQHHHSTEATTTHADQPQHDQKRMRTGQAAGSGSYITKQSPNPTDEDIPGGTVTGTGIIALSTPYLNVSLSGSVPQAPDTFALYLPCTGAVSAEVDVTLNINVTAPRPSMKPTVLFFKRRKICLKGNA